jgi:hypothetical protein
MRTESLAAPSLAPGKRCARDRKRSFFPAENLASQNAGRDPGQILGQNKPAGILRLCLIGILAGREGPVMSSMRDTIRPGRTPIQRAFRQFCPGWGQRGGDAPPIDLRCWRGILSSASRRGLAPSPTCHSAARWSPRKWDVARRRRQHSGIASPPSQEGYPKSFRPPPGLHRAGLNRRRLYVADLRPCRCSGGEPHAYLAPVRRSY